MITGLHAVMYTQNADELRAFFRDVLGFPFVDAGHGWLIFGMPPAEIAAHPCEAPQHGVNSLYLMCDNLEGTIKELEAKGVKFTQAITEQPWGRLTAMQIPGGELWMYQPTHASPKQAKSAQRKRSAPARKNPAARRKAARRRRSRRGD